MLFVLFPALIVAIAHDGATRPPPAPLPPVAAVAQPAFTDPDNPPKWWTDKMRQPCTKSGDLVLC